MCWSPVATRASCQARAWCTAAAAESSSSIVASMPGVQPQTGPLAGIRVVELSGLGPAPYACTLLAELGADVIRVDRPGGGTKLVPPDREVLHRSRPCVAVDLKSRAGREVVLRLVE